MNLTANSAEDALFKHLREINPRRLMDGCSCGECIAGYDSEYDDYGYDDYEPGASALLGFMGMLFGGGGYDPQEDYDDYSDYY